MFWKSKRRQADIYTLWEKIYEMEIKIGRLNQKVKTLQERTYGPAVENDFTKEIEKSINSIIAK